MHKLHTHIEIAAPPQDIWSVLVDFAAYPEWNPFMRYVDGAAHERTKLEVGIRPPGARWTKLRATVLVVRPTRELRWRTRLLVPKLFETEHWCLLVPLPSGEVRFEQNLRIGGLISSFLENRVDRNIYRGFREMNAALKGRVERCLASTAPPADVPSQMRTLEEVLLPDEMPAAAVEVEVEVETEADAETTVVESQVRRRRKAKAGSLGA